MQLATTRDRALARGRAVRVHLPDADWMLTGVVSMLATVVCLLTLASAPSQAMSADSIPVPARPPAFLSLAVAPQVQAIPAPAVATGSRAATARSQADQLVRRARTNQKAHRFTRATRLYERARDVYLKAGVTRRARSCRTAIQDMRSIMGTYPFTRAAMLDLLAEQYPEVSAAKRAAWLGLKSTETYTYDGRRHYFSELPTNLAFRDTALFQSNPSLMSKYRHLVQLLQPYVVAGAAAPAWKPYAEPAEYTFTQTLSVPRDALPADGDLRIWFPLPVEGGPQDDVRISDISPTDYLRYPPSTSQNIGLLYQFVHLPDLQGDLDVSFRVSFSHAAQYFKVEPSRVGAYDRSSALYRRYTASRANTQITPSIRRTARRVVAGERNPYLAAQRIWNHVIDQVTYSFMPHFAMYPRGQAESAYVHQHKYGDCGAQSMYFAALCRSVGIPSRCTGGFQLFTGVPAGHFWAEFYLPNYGWIPADPTAAEIIDYLPEYSAADKATFRAFFFGGQDDLRLTVQKDVDLPLVPCAHGRVALPMAIQFPTALCNTMDDIPGIVMLEHWKYE